MNSVRLTNFDPLSEVKQSDSVGIRLNGELIAGVGTDDYQVAVAREIGLGGSKLFPGFIDVHIHGAVGIDVNVADVAGLFNIGEYLAKNGVTAWMPTLVPDRQENYRRIIDAIDELMEIQTGKPVAQAVGVHYEGVFANEKMCGALRPEFFRSGRMAVGSRQSGVGGGQEMRKTAREQGRDLDADEERTTPSAEAVATPPQTRGELIGLPMLKRGVHMTTLAPEIDGGIELIEALVAEGWIVSIGHTRADTETLDRAYAAGARHMTHFFNAMTGVHHRDVGVAGWGLANDGVTFDIIADGVHVHPQMLGVACRAKSADKVSLISDSVAPTGLGDGEYELWGETVSVKNGKTQNERGSIAGSVISMLDAVKMMRSIGFSDDEVAKMASTNPAKLLGIDSTHGSIEVGKRADLVGIDADGNIAFTMIGGVIHRESGHPARP